MPNWFAENAVGLLSIIIGGFIAYHVYFLSKKLDLRDKLSNKNNLRKQVEALLTRIAKGIRRDVELVNCKKYEKHYPNDNEFNEDGYTYLRADLKALRFDGVEFFCSMTQSVYKKSDGSLSFSTESPSQEEYLRVFPVGIIPYSWIEFIDERGDEFSYRPQFFTNFEGPKKSPYKYIIYYKESPVYHEGNDPLDMKYMKVDELILP